MLLGQLGATVGTVMYLQQPLHAPSQSVVIAAAQLSRMHWFQSVTLVNSKRLAVTLTCSNLGDTCYTDTREHPLPSVAMSPPSSRKEKEAAEQDRPVSGSVQSDKKTPDEKKVDAAVEDADKPKEPTLTPSQQAYKRLVDCIHTLERAVITKESRLHLSE